MGESRAFRDMLREIPFNSLIIFLAIIVQRKYKFSQIVTVFKFWRGNSSQILMRGISKLKKNHRFFQEISLENPRNLK